MVTPNRINSHAAVLFANAHQGVHGWHAMYENNVENNLGNINQLVAAGLKGKIVVVLCGPFTSTQRALVKRKYNVNAEKVIRAFEWLKQNNHYYEDLNIPEDSSLMQPLIIEDKDT